MLPMAMLTGNSPHKMQRLLSSQATPDAMRGGIIALGNFDGFHLGHQAVVGAAVAQARARNVPAIVATFDPHPVRHFKPDAEPFRLTTLDQRQRLFDGAGADAGHVPLNAPNHQLASRSGVAPMRWMERSAPSNSSSAESRRPITAFTAP